ncbi:MAG: hypothetical protein ACP5O3_00830 [Candidatus Micrarchaeia archaeon]
MKGLVFSVEALLSLLAATGFAALVVTSNAPVGHERVYEFQLAQDFAEVLCKSHENRKAVVELAGGGEATALREKIFEAVHSLGNYCVKVKAAENEITVNCDRQPNNFASAQRTFFDGKKFFVASVSVGYFS